jgi:hypothetical protein
MGTLLAQLLAALGAPLFELSDPLLNVGREVAYVKQTAPLTLGYATALVESSLYWTRRQCPPGITTPQGCSPTLICFSSFFVAVSIAETVFERPLAT